jgi:heptosyltransferase-1
MRVLLVKMSSLGDVVHALPGVSDAAAALAGDGVGEAVTFDWVVEEAFAAIPARHPAVANVIPVAWRRWRRDLRASAGEMRAFLRRLRQQRYDVILDAQGLMKSAAVTILARGRLRAGLSRSSAREGAAALFYTRQVAVPRGDHAIDRIRLLFAGALGYPLPARSPDYGLDGPAVRSGLAVRSGPASRGSQRPRCLLLHGTTWESKHWPVRFWREIAERAAHAGLEVVVAWGNDDERRRAGEIAAGTSAQVLDRLPLASLMDEIAGAALVVGVDSGLPHLAAALDVPTLVIYGSSSSTLTGCRGTRVRNLQAEFPCSPCLSRVCSYRGPAQTWQGEIVVPACYATVSPDTVWRAATELLDADRILHI